MEINWFYFLAGVAALATWGLHTFVGGRLFARPLLATGDLHRIVRLTLYYCWHIVTVVIAGMSLGFFVVAVAPEYVALAIGLTGLAAALSVLSLAIIARHRASLFRMPQWSLFGVVAFFGFARLLAYGS